MKKEKQYHIGGKTFIQRPLVLGQLQQILELIAGLQIPRVITTPAVVAMLESRLPRAVAILLCEKGTRLKDKDLDALTEFMAGECDFATTLEVVENFFALNDLPCILDKLSRVSRMAKGLVAGSTAPSPSSPGETLPSGTTSSGDSLPKNASPTSSIESGT
jgi:hypothetical protein